MNPAARTARVITNAARILGRDGPLAHCTRCAGHAIDVVTFDGDPTKGILIDVHAWCSPCWESPTTRKDGFWVTALPGTQERLAQQSLTILVAGMVARGRFDAQWVAS